MSSQGQVYQSIQARVAEREHRQAITTQGISLAQRGTTMGEEEKNKDTTSSSTKGGGIVGHIKELGTHVFVAGLKQQHHYSKIKEEIASHIGGEHGMSMRNLVKDGIEDPPTEPTELTTHPRRTTPTSPERETRRGGEASSNNRRLT